MRVIGAAWGRTGTTSAAAALDILGLGPCVQMQTMWQQPALAAAWAGHYAGRTADWADLLGGFEASVDWPGAWEWRTFARLWPEAKVLLTLRDAPEWYDSVLGSIHAWTAPGVDDSPAPVTALLDRVWDVHFGGWEGFLDRDRAIGQYEAHVAEVRRDCPPARLVEWRVADGWEPLCAALGREVPDQPVPHLNARE